MKPKTMILMVVAVGCGLGASYMTSRLLAERSRVPPQEETIDVVVAKQKIAAWQPIKQPELAFELKSYPVSVAPKKPLKSLDQLKDQRLNKAVNDGAPVSEDDLLNAEQLGLIGRMKPGERAVAIKVNAESTLAGFIQPGYYVDVIVTTRGNDASSKYILQNMLVLAIDAQTSRDPERPSVLAQTVTLAAKPEEVTRMALASSLGDLRLTPRTLGDTRTIRHTITRPSDLDRPLKADRDGKGEETDDPGLERRGKSGGVVDLPGDLGPVKDPPRGGPLKVEEPRVEAPRRPKRKTHRLTIFTGAKVEKYVFRFHKKGDDDDDDEPSSSSSPPEEPAREAPRPEAKKEPKIEPKTEPKTPPTPAPPLGRRTLRTGRIN